MFGWLTDWFRDTAIAADFAKVEKLALLAHEQQAGALFPTAGLERQAAAIQAAIDAEVQARFGHEISAMERAITDLRGAIAAHQGNLAILARDYRAELAPLHDELHANKAKLQDLYDEKDSAYQDLNDAKDSLDSWYGKAERTPYLFGNAGRTLPRHALFSQSLGDRDSYREARDEAYETIAECREEIAKHKARNKYVYQRLQSVKADRQRYFDLRRAGQTQRVVAAKLDTARLALKEASHQRQQLDTRRLDFMRAAQDQRGLTTLKERVASLGRERAAFIAAFQAPSALAERQRLHREDWLRCHG